jgi:hypothetical protein
LTSPATAATPCRLTGAGGFDRRIESEQIGLTPNISDEVDHLTDALRCIGHLGDDGASPRRLLDGLGRQAGGLGNLTLIR